MFKKLLSPAVLLLCTSTVNAYAPLAQQRALDQDVPLLMATFPGTHNSYNSGAYRFWPYLFRYMFPNHGLSVTDQLDLGMRMIEYDAHWANHGSSGKISKEIILCHGLGNHTGCALTDRPLTQGLDELKTWLDKNPGQVVFLYIEQHLDGQLDRAVSQLENSLGHYLFKPKQLADITQSRETCASLPLYLTQSQILSIGNAQGAQSQVVVFAGGCTGDADSIWQDYVFAGFGGLKGGAVEGSVASFEGIEDDKPDSPSIDVYPVCSKNGLFKNDPNHKSIWRVREDRAWEDQLVDPSKMIEDKDTEIMTKCGINFPNYDELTKDDSRFKFMIWSWAAGYPQAGQSESAYYDNVSQHIKNDLPIDSALRAACKNMQDLSWQVTSSTQAFADSQAACQAMGAQWQFAMPVNGNQMQKLKDVTAEATWLNLSKRDNKWQVEAKVPMHWAIGFPDDGAWAPAAVDYKNCTYYQVDAEKNKTGLKNADCTTLDLPQLCYQSTTDSWQIASDCAQLSTPTASSWQVSVPLTTQQAHAAETALKQANVTKAVTSLKRNPEDGRWLTIASD